MVTYDHNQRAEDILLDNGCEDSVYFTDFAYDTAIIGVSTDGRVIYDYDKMVEFLMEFEGFTEDEATDWISYNAIGSINCNDNKMPIIMNKII